MVVIAISVGHCVNVCCKLCLILKKDCHDARHVIVIRVVAYRCYEFPGEKIDDYHDQLLCRIVDECRQICGHNSFTILLLCEKECYKPSALANVVICSLEIPFENVFYSMNKSLPLGLEAQEFFLKAFEPLKNIESADELRKSLVYPFKVIGTN